MHPIVVQKYGGSSVADAGRIEAVARRIAATCAAGKAVCVVVSAMGSTTNELMARAREISPSPPRRELDMLVTCGERASMALLSMAVHQLGLEAISLTGSQAGIMTNDRHSGARIIEVRPFRVWDELERGKVVIVAGFQGVSYKREITTLGRGGSDTTAVALAAALGAEYCEICSDVDGVYSADPRVVSAAELLDAISHDAMLELAAHGAKVLHPAAVEVARQRGVALYARATRGGGEGTRIDVAHLVERARQVVGVTGHKQLVRVGGGDGDGLLGWAAAEALTIQAAIELGALPCAEGEGARWEPGNAAALILALDDAPDWPAVAARAAGRGLVVEPGWGAVTAVGDFVGGDAGLLGRARAAARGAGIEPRGMVTSPLRLTLYCATDEVDRLVAALHRALVEGA
jgi:aspartate kinase